MLLATLELSAKRFFLMVDGYARLTFSTLVKGVSRPFYLRETAYQFDRIGVESLFIILLTGLFTGMVLALQGVALLGRFGANSYLGSMIGASIVRELGPVLAALMVAGRVGSSIAAELGNMAVTEQIDAMRALGTDPTRKLVTPRLTATMFMLFFLTILSDLVGLAGGSAGGLGRHWGRRADGSVTPMRGCDSVEVGAGDGFVVETPGGGGYGDPAKRRAEARERDRTDGYV